MSYKCSNLVFNEEVVFGFEFFFFFLFLCFHLLNVQSVEVDGVLDTSSGNDFLEVNAPINKSNNVCNASAKA